MPSRVSVFGNHEMGSSISVQPRTNDVSLEGDSIPDQEQTTNEQLFKAINEIYSPVLKLMKLFGIYFGDASLKRLRPVSGSCTKRMHLQRSYCGVVVFGFWLNFVMAFVDLFFGASFYLFLMFSLWCLLIALSGTICFIVLYVPLADTGKSRFENFLRAFLVINRNVNLEKVKSKSRKGIIVCCVFFIIASVGVLSTQLLLPTTNLSAFMPWKQWFGFKIISAIFLFLGCGVWLLPTLFLCITCLILEEMFDEFQKRISSFQSISLSLPALKMEFHKLCEVVELADGMLGPLLLGMVSVYIPLNCFNFYQAVILPQKGNVVLLLANLSWIPITAGVFAIVMLFGSKVSEKIHGLQKILQTFPVSKEDEGQLVMFMLDLQGDPKGVSLGGLTVITKSMSLTIVGVIISYFAVMLSLPK